MMRSPSFSREGESRTMTNSPWAGDVSVELHAMRFAWCYVQNAAIASGIESNMSDAGVVPLPLTATLAAEPSSNISVCPFIM